MKLNTRNLYANEIKAKIAKINKGGVKLLLWKSSLADLTILDEALDPSDYEITYPSEGICRISIWDEKKGNWVSKEGIGEGNSPKSLANDSLMRAGIAWGIGRELYTAEDIFIFKDKLKTYKEEKDGEGKDIFSCYDEFIVQDIKYQNNAISYLKIGIALYGKVHASMEFNYSQNNVSAPSGTKAAPLPVETAASDSKSESSCNSTVPKDNEILKDDEIILMGNCRGKKFCDVCGTETFNSFLHWAKTATTKYSDPKMAEQFIRIKKYAQELSA